MGKARNEAGNKVSGKQEENNAYLCLFVSDDHYFILNYSPKNIFCTNRLICNVYIIFLYALQILTSLLQIIIKFTNSNFNYSHPVGCYKMNYNVKKKF